MTHGRTVMLQSRHHDMLRDLGSHTGTQPSPRGSGSAAAAAPGN